MRDIINQSYAVFIDDVDSFSLNTIIGVITRPNEVR